VCLVGGKGGGGEQIITMGDWFVVGAPWARVGGQKKAEKRPKGGDEIAVKKKKTRGARKTLRGCVVQDKGREGGEGLSKRANFALR